MVAWVALAAAEANTTDAVRNKRGFDQSTGFT
jgi:hypothetical protein